MDTLKLIAKLMNHGYSLTLIAKQAKIPYMDLYRSVNNDRPLREDEEAAIKRFALVQPCIGQ